MSNGMTRVRSLCMGILSGFGRTRYQARPWRKAGRAMRPVCESHLLSVSGIPKVRKIIERVFRDQESADMYMTKDY